MLVVRKWSILNLQNIKTVVTNNRKQNHLKSMLRKYIFFGSLFFFSLSFSFLFTDVEAEVHTESIPSSLAEWVPWIQDKNPEWNCAKTPKGTACTWIGKVTYSIADNETDFELEGLLLRGGDIPLPSSSKLVSSHISVYRDGSKYLRYTVSREEGKSAVVGLPKGTYKITGKLLYEKTPSEIPAPSEYGLIEIVPSEVSVKEGAGTIRYYRGKDQIYIEKKAQSEIEIEDSVRVELFRSIQDGSPLKITTRLRLQVSGNPRTISFGKVLPKNSVISRVNSTLQYSLNNSELSLQVYQGSHDVELVSLLSQPVYEIDVSDVSSELLPEEEIWVWNAYPQFRGVEISGARSLNPSQVRLPSGFRGSSTLGVARESKIVLKEIRRGEEVAPKNSLFVTRTIYPKLDKSGFIIQDEVSGTLNSATRLNMLPELEPGGAFLNHAPVPLTIDPGTNESGVEIRETQFVLSGTSAFENSFSTKTTFKATGWNSEMEQVNLNLPLPPSWKLLAVSGVSSAKGTWVSLWNSYEIFLLLILSIFVMKLFNKKLAVLFLVFSVISKGEFMNPCIFFAWLMVFYAASTALNSTAHKTLQAAIYGSVFLSLAAYCVQTLSFAKLQFIQFLHPQLQSGTRYRSLFQEIASLIEMSPLIWPTMLFFIFVGLCVLFWAMKGESWGYKVGRLVLGGFFVFIVSGVVSGVVGLSALFLGSSFDDSSESYLGAPASHAPEAMMSSSAPSEISYDDTRILSKIAGGRRQVQKPKDRELQSGLFVPEWRWKTASALIRGPVPPSYEVSMYYLPSGIERFLCALRSCLSIVLFVWSLLLIVPRDVMARLSSLAARHSVCFLIVLSALMGAKEARAEFPPEAYLKDLENRLESRLCKEAECSTIHDLSLVMDEGTYVFKISASSIGKSVVRIPGKITDFSPKEIVINGSRKSYARINEEHLEVLLENGLSSVEVRGELRFDGSITVRFPQLPLDFSYTSSSWRLDKVLQRGEVPTELKLIRESVEKGESPGTADRHIGVEEFPETFIVHRVIRIGEHIEVSGVVNRLGRSDKSATIEVPLQKNEILTSPEWKSRDGNIVMSFTADSSSSYFQSRIDFPKESLVREFLLSVSHRSGVFERWDIICEDYIFCDISGLPLTRDVGASNEIKQSFLPFSGETLSVSSRLLESAPGAFLTIEEVVHGVSWGESRLKGSVYIRAKATRQAPLQMRLSNPDIEILSVKVGDTQDARKFNYDEISILLEPGEQAVTVEYARAFSPEIFEKVEEVFLNSPAGNIRTNIGLPIKNYRWLVYFGGGEWGPASLFWSKLLVTLLVLSALRYVQVLNVNIFLLVGFGIGLSMVPTILQPLPVLLHVLFQSMESGKFPDEKFSPLLRKTLMTLLLIAGLFVLYLIIRVGLLGEPTSLIAGNRSSQMYLSWYHDISLPEDASYKLPAPWVLSLPMMYWRILTHGVAILMVFIGLGWVQKWVGLLKK